jgi:hypothetical protein
MSHNLSAALLAAALLVSATPTLAQETAQADSGEGAIDDFSDLDQSAEGEAAVDPEVGEQNPEGLEALARMADVIDALDPDAERNGNNWQLTVEETSLLVVTDITNDRMRILTAIAMADTLPSEALLRLLQADFDSALDARYAIAQDLVWGTFIHPLSSLTTREFASGLLQTKSLADTFGTTFSSGILTYGGGDSSAIIEKQLEELLEELKKGEET